MIEVILGLDFKLYCTFIWLISTFLIIAIVNYKEIIKESMASTDKVLTLSLSPINPYVIEEK